MRLVIHLRCWQLFDIIFNNRCLSVEQRDMLLSDVAVHTRSWHLVYYASCQLPFWLQHLHQGTVQMSLCAKTLAKSKEIQFVQCGCCWRSVCCQILYWWADGRPRPELCESRYLLVHAAWNHLDSIRRCIARALVPMIAVKHWPCTFSSSLMLVSGMVAHAGSKN